MVRINPTKQSSAKVKRQDAKNQFLWAEGQQESGGNYHVVNPNSGALGRWQVMPENLPGWAREARLPVESSSYFLQHPAYQDKLVYAILGGDYDKYGARGAASVWYSGQPDWHATYGDPPVYVYVNSVIRLMGGAPVSGVGSSGLSQTGSLGPYLKWGVAAPKPGKESWAKQIDEATRHFRASAGTMQRDYETIRRLRIRA